MMARNDSQVTIKQNLSRRAFSVSSSSFQYFSPSLHTPYYNIEQAWRSIAIAATATITAMAAVTAMRMSITTRMSSKRMLRCNCGSEASPVG